MKLCSVCGKPNTDTERLHLMPVHEACLLTVIDVPELAIGDQVFLPEGMIGTVDKIATVQEVTVSVTPNLKFTKPATVLTKIKTSTPPNRTKIQVLAARRTHTGCCDRFCDNMGCDCLENAI